MVTYSAMRRTTLPDAESVSKIGSTHSFSHDRTRRRHIRGRKITSLQSTSSWLWKRWRLQAAMKSDLKSRLIFSVIDQNFF